MSKANRKLLVTGSSGLIGSEVCTYFSKHGWEIHGIDNNQRARFFGPEADTRWNQQRLSTTLQAYTHHDVDVRNRDAILQLIAAVRPDAIVHAAAQPSHDLAARIPFDDFDVNAVGTLNLLEATRRAAPDAVFVFLSTNKVYGDAPNEISRKELASRWEFADPQYSNGISEDFRIDQSKHSLFGASKVAADIMVQEYGRYFGLRSCCLRGGCLTGPQHGGVELHGFLSYLTRCNLEGKIYRIYGYKGKQVRDNIHAYDVASFIEQFINAPRVAEVYNIGGGKENSCSIIEAIEMISRISQKPMSTEYVDQNREGDHVVYYSDLRKMTRHYPGWRITRPLELIISEIVDGWYQRLADPARLRSSVHSITTQIR